MNEDPEDFFCDVGDLTTPDAVWAWLLHLKDEFQGLG